MRLQWIAAWVPLVLVSGCANSPASWKPDSAKLTSPGVLAQAPAPLITPTYDGKGQATEPTVVYFPGSWQGHFYWMVLSPYPYGDARFENPSVLVSEDGQNWSVPSGLSNPVWLPTQGHLSDATLLYDDASNQLSIYFLNEILGPEHYFLLRTTSADGSSWSLPEVLLSGNNYSVSPTVTKVGSTFYMWTIDSDSGCTSRSTMMNRRSSSDGATWSPPEPVNISQPGFAIWHLNVISVPSEGQFMSMIAAYPVGSDCGHTKLFFANSNDGVNWTTYPRPIMDVGSGWDSKEIYRSSLVYDPERSLFRVWYSASDVKGEWNIGYTETSFRVDY